MLKVLIVFVLIFYIYDFPKELRAAPNKTLQKILAQQWGEDPHAESTTTQVLLFLPRLIYAPVEKLVTGEIVDRTLNLGKGLVYLVASPFDGDYLDKSISTFNDSLINVLGTPASVISDAVSIVKSPFYKDAWTTRRILVCTINFVNWEKPGLIRLAGLINPLHHVDFAVDGNAYGFFGTPQARKQVKSSMCFSAPILSDNSSSLVIERMTCVYNYYKHGDYNFGFNNCVTKVKNIFDMSDIGFPLHPNAGWGLWPFRNSITSEHRKQIKKLCDDNTDHIRKIIFDLEHGKDLDKEETYYMLKKQILFLKRLYKHIILVSQEKSIKHLEPEKKAEDLKKLKEYMEKIKEDRSLYYATTYDKDRYWPFMPLAYSSDVHLQLIISAARGKNDKNRKHIIKYLKEIPLRASIYYKKGGLYLKDFYKPLLRKMFYGIDDEAYIWMRKYFNMAAYLYRAAYAKELLEAYFRKNK